MIDTPDGIVSVHEDAMGVRVYELGEPVTHEHVGTFKYVQVSHVRGDATGAEPETVVFGCAHPYGIRMGVAYKRRGERESDHEALRGFMRWCERADHIN